jgi:hypothetical protein
MIFVDDLASRLANRVQLTSDGHKAYLEAPARPNALAFSKKVENHAHAVALQVYYNFVRVHQTFRMTPAMSN